MPLQSEGALTDGARIAPSVAARDSQLKYCDSVIADVLWTDDTMRSPLTVTDSDTYRVQRWRFFVNTCWVSWTAGFLIYILTLVFGYPYGWAALLLAARAGFWSLGDMDRYRLTISDKTVEGPGLLLTSERRSISIDRINARRTGIRGGRFFIEDDDGNTITSRLFWYDRIERDAILNFLRTASHRLHLNLKDLILET
ncbi:MAG: hypothetical protein Aurels2KO_56220 [Aureliella sp.]